MSDINTTTLETGLTENNKPDLTQAEQFTNKVLKEIEAQGLKGLDLTEYERSLVYGYFIKIDKALKDFEDSRLEKNSNNTNHKFDNNLPYTWDNVNLTTLAVDCANCARLGLDMSQPNHLHPIAYKNRRTQKYDMGLIRGYDGIRYIAMEYAVEPPVKITCELVYSNDKFIPMKKSFDNSYDNYAFELTQPFNRGYIIGGFGYIQYSDNSKNELILMSLNDILKRKPEKASNKFWGKIETKIEEGKLVDISEDGGWFAEMCNKTLIRYVCSKISIDPKKVNNSYEYTKQRERELSMIELENMIEDTTPETETIIDGDYREIENPTEETNTNEPIDENVTPSSAPTDIDTEEDPY